MTSSRNHSSNRNDRSCGVISSDVLVIVGDLASPAEAKLSCIYESILIDCERFDKANQQVEERNREIISLNLMNFIRLNI
jgi:hypothetical protein